MKTLYLLRHAKSGWGDPGAPDSERPLEARGERDAARMARRWANQHAKPDRILSSPARRALATATLVAEGFGCRPDGIVVDERLYAATAETLLAVIESLDEPLDCVMLVAHNPGLTDLAGHFSSEITHMPTCALATFRFDAKSWSGIGQARPTESEFDSPKLSQA